MDANKLIEKLKAGGFEPFSYSGRFMYGKECVAIEMRRGEYPPVKGASSDSLGMGMVWYWPSAEAPKDLK